MESKYNGFIILSDNKEHHSLVGEDLDYHSNDGLPPFESLYQTRNDPTYLKEDENFIEAINLFVKKDSATREFIDSEKLASYQNYDILRALYLDKNGMVKELLIMVKECI